MEDITGQPVSLPDIADAQRAVRTAIVRHMSSVPPELAIQLPNILRCLTELAGIKAARLAGEPEQRPEKREQMGLFGAEAEPKKRGGLH